MSIIAIAIAEQARKGSRTRVLTFEHGDVSIAFCMCHLPTECLEAKVIVDLWNVVLPRDGSLAVA